jgi:PadR family transcriptional regulator PadR
LTEGFITLRFKVIYGGKIMKMLTRAEEYILLAVLKLGVDAYSIPILEHIEKMTQKKWTLGGIYIPLYRLEEKGYLRSELGSPTKERGGKRKRYYQITLKGKNALKSQKKIQMAMWDEVGKTALE